MFERMTTDARAVIARMPSLAIATGRRKMSVWDLAAALSTPSGNTATLWRAPTPDTSPTAELPPDGLHEEANEPPPGPPSAETEPASKPPRPRFDSPTRMVLEQALRVALHERAQHIGTEHLMAALVRTGPPDVVAWLAARNASAETVDALLSRLRGGAGVERLPGRLSVAHRLRWRWATASVRGARRIRHPFAMVTVVIIVTVVVFVLCVWGP